MAGFPQRDLLTGSQVWTGDPGPDADASQKAFDGLSLLYNQLRNRVIALERIGEYTESVVAAGTVGSWASGTPQNITSLSLTEGIWLVSGQVFFSNTSATPVTRIGSGINTTSATLPAVGPFRGQATNAVLNPTGFGVPVGPTRLSLLETTTVYLVGIIDFGAGTPSAGGFINAFYLGSV